jgi:hypothetical protein
MHVNCRSIAKNFNEILNLLHPIKSPVMAIAVTETWLTTDNHHLYKIPGKKFISQPRINKVGGGTGLFISDEIEFILRNDLCRNQPEIECLFIELPQLSKKNFILGCIYRPPNTDINIFNNTLLNILQTLDGTKYGTIAMAGDFNLDLKKNDSHGPTAEFINNMLTYSYLPTVNILGDSRLHSPDGVRKMKWSRDTRGRRPLRRP